MSIEKHVENSTKPASDYPLNIRHLDNPDTIIDDLIVIKQKLTSYWSNLSNTSKKNDPHLSQTLEELYTESPGPNALQQVQINEPVLNKAISTENLKSLYNPG